MTQAKLKDPADRLDYSHDWTAWLDGDTITSSAWAAPAGVTTDTPSNTTTTTRVWVSGGTAGNVYRITNTITTAGGRTAERSIPIRVQDR